MYNDNNKVQKKKNLGDLLAQHKTNYYRGNHIAVAVGEGHSYLGYLILKSIVKQEVWFLVEV